jgi:hypothetical protein
MGRELLAPLKLCMWLVETDARRPPSDGDAGRGV